MYTSKKIFDTQIYLKDIFGQVQLTVKGSSNRTLPRYEDPILAYRLGYVKVPRIEEDTIRGTFYRQLHLIRYFFFYYYKNILQENKEFN